MKPSKSITETQIQFQKRWTHQENARQLLLELHHAQRWFSEQLRGYRSPSFKFKCRLNLQEFKEIEHHMAYLACSLAKPLWASIEELIPGKRVGFNDSKSASTSVRSASLHTSSALLLKLQWKNWTNIFLVLVPWWATMTVASDGEKPTYPSS